jgi:hypothetical protein
VFDVSRSGAKLVPVEGLEAGGAVVLRFEDGHEIPINVKWVRGNEAGVALPPGSINAARLEKLKQRAAQAA